MTTCSALLKARAAYYLPTLTTTTTFNYLLYSQPYIGVYCIYLIYLTLHFTFTRVIHKGIKLLLKFRCTDWHKHISQYLLSLPRKSYKKWRFKNFLRKPKLLPVTEKNEQYVQLQTVCTPLSSYVHLIIENG